MLLCKGWSVSSKNVFPLCITCFCEKIKYKKFQIKVISRAGLCSRVSFWCLGLLVCFCYSLCVTHLCQCCRGRPAYPAAPGPGGLLACRGAAAVCSAQVPSDWPLLQEAACWVQGHQGDPGAGDHCFRLPHADGMIFAQALCLAAPQPEKDLILLCLLNPFQPTYTIFLLYYIIKSWF